MLWLNVRTGTNPGHVRLKLATFVVVTSLRHDAPRPTFASQCKSLTAARQNNKYLGKVNAQSLQQTLRRLEKAFVSMWEQNHGFPRFKKVGRMRSFSFPQLGKNPLQNGYIKLPVIGKVKLRQSRSIHASCFMPAAVATTEGTSATRCLGNPSTALAPDGGVLKQARVVKRVSGWYIMLTVQWDVNPPQPMPHGEGIGIDVGLTSMVATSSGLLIKRPRFFVDAERKLKLLRQKAVWILLPLYCRATTC